MTTNADNRGATEEVFPLTDALQLAWNEWCMDTGCVPDGFSIHGPRITRVVADFNRGSAFVRQVELKLAMAGYRIVKDADK